MSMNLHVGVLLTKDDREEMQADVDKLNAALAGRGLPNYVEPKRKRGWGCGGVLSPLAELSEQVERLQKEGRITLPRVVLDHLLKAGCDCIWLPSDFQESFHMHEALEASESGSGEECDEELDEDEGEEDEDEEDEDGGDEEEDEDYEDEGDDDPDDEGDEDEDEDDDEEEDDEDADDDSCYFGFVGSSIRLLEVCDAALPALGFDRDPGKIPFDKTGEGRELEAVVTEWIARDPKGRASLELAALGALILHQASRFSVEQGLAIYTG